MDVSGMAITAVEKAASRRLDVVSGKKNVKRILNAMPGRYPG